MNLFRNTVAKQEAFEEKIRLKNQFRALDEDEVDFLDSVLESTRAQEAAVKKDTADQLEIFRKQREEAEKAMLGSTASEVGPVEEEEWTIPARKRRRDRGRELLLPGKKRKGSGEGETGRVASGPESVSEGSEVKTGEDTAKGLAENTQKSITEQQADNKLPAKAPSSVGLVGYGSDSDSE